MGTVPNALYEALLQDLSLSLPAASVTQQVAICSLTQSFIKKWQGKIPGENPKRRALDEFITRATFHRFISKAPFAKGFIHQTLGNLPDASEVALGVRYSSGSSQKMPMGSTSAYTKHCVGPISVSTEELYLEYMGLLRDFDPPGFRDAIYREKFRGDHVITPSSRIQTVPKTTKIDRVIAVEPTVNGFLQQGVKSCLESRLRKVGIDLQTQQGINRNLARRGSLGHGFATIDLTAASDSISRRLLQYLLPSDWCEYIQFVSCSSFTLGGVTYEADCIALTMGNAITFPLQTLIFLALVYEAYCRLGLPFRVNETVAVFGDDIICLESAYATVCDVLVGMGFEPNPDKSFATGDFRESCGADWYAGHNVRGVYLYTLDTPGDAYAARNKLAAWSYRWGVSLPRTLGMLDDAVVRLQRGRKALLVPPHSPIDSGIRVFDAPPGALTQDWSYRYKTWNSRGPKRGVGAILHYRSIVQFALQGAIAGHRYRPVLCERPKSTIGFERREQAPYWSLYNVAEMERWMYDTTCTSSDVVTDRHNLRRQIEATFSL